jgi:hypothetical protein
MKKVRNRVVVERWHASSSAESHTGSFHTDGSKLYSYGLCIGDTSSDGKKFLKDYTAAGSYGFRSQTTSCHVGLARRYADVVL